MLKRNFNVYSEFDGVNIVCKSSFGRIPITATKFIANTGSVRRKYNPNAHYTLGKPTHLYTKAISELESEAEKPANSKAVQHNAKTLKGRKMQKVKVPSKTSKKPVEEVERTLRQSRERLRLLDGVYTLSTASVETDRMTTTKRQK